MHARRVFAGRAIVAFARPNPDGRWRVGVATSRKLRGAVLRNRVRRRLREVARRCLLPPGPPPPAGLEAGDVSAAGGGAGPQVVTVAYDVVLIGRPDALDLPIAALEEETARVRKRLLESGA
jgi:RNase P protein component